MLNKKHKLKKIQTSPYKNLQLNKLKINKKYRAELNRARRKAGVYGKGGKDFSHTKRGTLVRENASKNRARNRSRK